MKFFSRHVWVLEWLACVVSAWLPQVALDLVFDMGADWWPYGLAANKAVLDTFLRYHHEQGLSKRRFAAEELFAPETLESYKV